MNDISTSDMWYSAGFANGNPDHEVTVRAWRPGDGLKCSHANKRSKTPCGAPVALERRYRPRVPSYRTGNLCSETTTRVVCLRHLASTFLGEMAYATDEGVERSAIEKLATLHWDEYQALIAQAQQAALDERLGALPADLRSQIVAVMDENSDPA